MTSCPQCLKALQVALHEVFVENCIGCVVRRLALMSSEEREWYLDRLQHLCGWDTRAEVLRMVTLERARIAALKERTKT